MMRGSEEHAAARWRARPWRKLAIPAGLLLAATIFLPAVPSCNSDVIPAAELASAVHSCTAWPLNWDAALWLLCGICAFLSAYLAGFLLAFAALARLRGWHGCGRLAEKCLLGVLLYTAVITSFFFTWASARYGAPSAEEWEIWLAYLVGPVVVLLYLLAAWRYSGSRFLSYGFILCLWIFCWFGGWFVLVFDTVRYGLRLSFVASGLLLVAMVGEARAVTGQTWRRTLGQLLTARLAKPLELRGCCPKCDYFLYGLSEMRCPECGRVFRFEELGVSAEEMGFQMSSVDPRTSSG